MNADKRRWKKKFTENFILKFDLPGFIGVYRRVSAFKKLSKLFE